MSAREDPLVEEPYPAQPILSGNVVYLANTGAANRAAVDPLVFSARRMTSWLTPRSRPLAPRPTRD